MFDNVLSVAVLVAAVSHSPRMLLSLIVNMLPKITSSQLN